MKHKHTLRTGISLLLVLCMVLSLCPLTAFAKADDKPKLNLVSFGDSMTNGYGHDGYYEGNTQVNGFLQNDVETTYPYYLAKELKKTYNVNWEALAVSCMRTEDVNFLLRYHTDEEAWNTLAAELDDIDSTVDNWNNAQKARWEETFVDDGNVIGDYFTWNEFVNGRFWDWQKTTGNANKDGYTWYTNPTLAYAKYYQNAVESADVITLGTGNANFGVIMLQNITSLLTGTFGSGFKDAVPVREVIERRFPAEIKDTAVEILDKVDELVEPNLTMLEGKAAKVLEIVEYTTASFMFSYMDMLHAIDKLNDKDNLDVIMMGLMNTMDGVKIDTGNGILDLGAVVDGITDVLSTYYFVLPVALQELNGDFENITFYIVPNDDHIEMQVSDMASLEKIKESNTIRERMIQEVSGMIFNLVRTPLNSALSDKGVELPTWSMNDDTAYQYREKVETYEALQESYKTWVDGGYTGTWNPPISGAAGNLLRNPNDMLACAVYLAFEQAIIANAKNATLDLNGLMSLMGGTDALAGMITPITGALTGESGAFGESKQQEMQNKVIASAGAQLTALLAAEGGNGTHTSGVASASGETQEEKAANYAATAFAPMFTAIELTNALNGALGTALTSDEAESLGGLLSLFARMLIGNGIGSHPTADGHLTLFNEIMEVYPDKPAKEKLIEMAKEYGEKLYDLALEYGAEALTKVVDYVAEKEYITDEQTAALKALIAAADKAIKTGDTDDLLAICEEIAQDLYTYVVANGKVPEEVQKAVNEFFRIYDEMKDLTPEQQKAYVKAMLEDLTEKYGPEALEKLNDYVLSLDVLDERQLAELEAKIWDFINAYPDAPDATVDAAIDELVDFLFEVAKLDKDKVMEMYEYLTTTSREQMLADAAELMQKYLDKYGPEALEYVENYLIGEGYVTAEEIAEITKQVKLAIAAYEAQDKAAMKASCEKLAELIYAYADAKGYIPAEVKEAYAKAIELYNKYGEMTPEEIKALAAAELKKFIAEHKAEALIALDTYLVNEGWMSTTDMKVLAEKIAAAIAAYEADPEGTADAMIEELVGYIYNKAVAEGYIDPAKVEELNKLVDLIKEACDYFANTPEEQIKADAIALLFDELDKLTDGKVNAEVYAQIKQDLAGLIAALEDITPETIQAKVDAYINSIKAKYLELIDDATHGKYVPNGESYYVALGGDTVYGTGIGRDDEGYFDLLLEELGLDGKTQYKNLGAQNLDLTKLLAYIEKNADEIEKADLITYQADATAFILAALNEETPDWSRYLTAEQIAFVEQALPVIQTILEDDWTKYADLDAEKIVDDIETEVLGAIDDTIMDAFNGQADKLDEMLSICVAQVKSYVEYIQEQAFELYFEAVIGETVLYLSLMEPVYEVLGEDWASYAKLDAEQTVAEIKDEVLTKAGKVKGISEEKIPELLERCVEKALELHEYADAEIAKLPEYFSDEELAFAQAAFEFVWEYALKQWPELAELDVTELHDKAYAGIMKLLTEADNFNYEQYVDLGAEKIEEILNCCVDKAMTAIEDIQSRTAEAVSVIEKAEFVRFLKEALNFAFDYLAEDWTVYVDKSAAWVSNKIKNAVIAEMYQHSSFGKEYVDQYADELTAILTACIEEVQNVLQTAQNQKDEVLNVLNTIEPFKPYIEKLLFASVAYAVDTAKAVDAIQAINPDATLIVVGMYNPLDGLEIVMNGKTIDVGAYMDYLIDATNVYYTALAVADGEFTFVAVPDTEINGFEKAIDVDALDVADLGMTLLGLNNSMYADAAGHENIFTRIMDALDTTNELVSISVTTAPIKTSYVAGQNFDPTGMVIEATYYNGTTADVTGWKVTDGTALTAGKTFVTISYTEDDDTVTCTQDITVVAKALTGISVKTAPTKTSYTAGQAFDSTGMVITATYNDGTTVDKNSGWTVTDGNNLPAGKTSVTISYTEGGVTKTTTQAITVTATDSGTGGGGGGGGGGAAPAITVPVSGDKDSLEISATVNSGNATVKNVTSEQIETVGTGDNVVIDLSGLDKSVSGMIVPKTTFENVAKSDADGLEVKLPNGITAVFDKTAVAAIANQATGEDIQLVVDRDAKAEQSMTAAQKATIKTLNNPVVLNAYFVSGGKRISNFKGGEAELTAIYPTQKPVRVWYVMDNGTKELVPSTFDGKSVTFVVKHFSHYVIEALDDAQGGYANCPKDVTCPISRFTDTKADFWWHDGIHYCIENGMMNGVSATGFAPNATLTRGMVVTVLARLNGVEAGTGNAWYVPGQEWAMANGISDGTNMTSAITREQLATMLYRYAQFKGIDTNKFTENTNTLSHNDVFTISDWATSGMHFCIAAGVVGGDDKGNLNPHNTATRAEAAAMFQRFCENVTK